MDKSAIPIRRPPGGRPRRRPGNAGTDPARTTGSAVGEAAGQRAGGGCRRGDLNPAPGYSAVRGRSGECLVTCDSRSPTPPARARRGPAVPDAVRTQRGPGRQAHRELGKHPRTAPDGVILQLSGSGDEPWLSVGDRWKPMVRARWGHGRRERTRLGLVAMVTSSAGGLGRSRATRASFQAAGGGAPAQGRQWPAGRADCELVISVLERR